jgi:prepilin-type N-terminal cleavage/methylation domain-containing protein
MQKIRNAFTMLELIFVIVIMGIIGTFGTEFLAQSYNSYIYSQVNNTLQSNSATAVEFIATRLQHRIKKSVIARIDGAGFVPLANVLPGNATLYDGFEWVSADIDNFRGLNAPNWSGIIDLNDPFTAAANLISPATNTGAINTTIFRLSNGASGIGDSALYFIGRGVDDVINGYGWNGAINNQSGTMHPITAGATVNSFTPRTLIPSFAGGSEVSEYYKLAWTANAVILRNRDADGIGDLFFYYDYQPWDGESYQNAKRVLLMEGVKTFQAMALGNVIKIQVCTASRIIDGENDVPGGYSLCKEKTIF